VDCILGLIVQYIGLLVCVLVVWLTLTYQNIPSLYVQIDTFDSSNYSDQSMIQIMLLKIETLVFMQHKTLTKENQAAIVITYYNPWSMFTLTFKQNMFLFGSSYRWILY